MVSPHLTSLRLTSTPTTHIAASRFPYFKSLSQSKWLRYVLVIYHQSIYILTHTQGPDEEEPVLHFR